MKWIVLIVATIALLGCEREHVRIPIEKEGVTLEVRGVWYSAEFSYAQGERGGYVEFVKCSLADNILGSLDINQTVGCTFFPGEPSEIIVRNRPCDAKICVRTYGSK